MQSQRIITRSELLKNYDEIPVGSNIHFEGAPVFSEFPAKDWQAKKVPIKKQIQKKLTGFSLRTKKWWSGLQKRRIPKTMGKPQGKKLNWSNRNLKNRTMFNKSKKFDAFKNSFVLEKPIREKIYAKDLPPTQIISKAELIKNYDEIPVGAHVHFEGAPIFGEFPAKDWKAKSLPMKKQIQKKLTGFSLRTKKWWSGLQKRRLPKTMGKPQGKKLNWSNRTLKKRTVFNKTQKFNHWAGLEVRLPQKHTAFSAQQPILGQKLQQQFMGKEVKQTKFEESKLDSLNHPLKKEYKL